MKKAKKYISIFLCIALFLTSVIINGSFSTFAAEEPIKTGVVDSSKVTSNLNVRSGPGASHNYLGSLNPGDTVTIYGIENGWYKIAFSNSYGYVSGDYITNVKDIPKYDYNANFETNLTNQGFPESYKVLLRQLHANHPSWVFTADHLAMTWEDAVANESFVGKSLVHSSAKASWKSMASGTYEWATGTYVPFDSGGWVTAERDVVEYYMEPRNFLNESSIFMFLDQTYNPNLQNKEGLQLILNGTFMEGEFPEDTYETYNDVIMDAAQKSGVSPYVLAASIIIEQGSNGRGNSISGTVSGYQGYYNFFNVRAYASDGYDAVTYGLLYAKGSGSYGRPWNTRAKSILGGAEHYASGYVKRGQDNLYYKKFNVITPTYYVNQYMTNVQGAYSEASKLRDAYSSVNSDAQLSFAIPVYKEMPEKNTTALPTSNGANNYYLTSISVDGQAVANFNIYVNEYEIIVPHTTSSVNVTADVLSGASVSGTGKANLAEGDNKVTLTVTAASGKKANYTLSVFREASPNSSETTEPTVETGYKVSSYVSGVALGSDVSTFLSKFKVKNGSARILNASNAQKTSGTISTGDKVQILDSKGQVKIAYSIVIFGDINGDGSITAIDMLRIKKHLLEINKLQDVYSVAADINQDNKLTAIDSLRLKKHILQITTIVQ